MTRPLVVEYMSLLARSLLSRPRFATSDVRVGRGVVFGRDVRFRCKRVRIGDGVVIQDHVRVDVDEFEIGDFGTIYFGCFFPGPGRVKIGHNFWLGNSSIIDGRAGTTIGDNVGIGAHSQLWTHMMFGDVAAGCRFDSSRPLVLGSDVWLVGHNLVSPVTIGDRALAMLGSLIVRDVPADRTVAGSPASDQTDKFGAQFQERSPEQRREMVCQMIQEFASKHRIDHIWDRVEVTRTPPLERSGRKTIIDVSTRTYLKTGSLFELLLMRGLLPRAKFVPMAGA